MMDSKYLRQLNLSIASTRNGPIYRRISRALERGIAKGVLTPGLRLPAERQLATSLGVSRATIVKAFQELEARGLVRGYVGCGTFVAAAPEASGAPFAWRGKISSAALRSSDTTIRDLVRDSSDPALLSTGAGVPALDVFPAEAFQHAVERVIRREAPRLWGHSPTEGVPVLREAIARRSGGRPEDVLVLAGAQQGLDLLARCLIDPGDTVIIDRPGYLGALHTFRSAGARLIGWDTVRHDLDELEDLVVRYRPKLIYTNPTFQNPSGWTMPLRLRRDLVALAARLRVPIVEDDTYRELHLGQPPPPTLKTLDSQSIVIHLNTFSKVLAPGLRLGWLSAAQPIVEQLALIKQRADPHTENLVQYVLADLLTEGTFDKHLTTLRTEHMRRRDAMAAALQRHGKSGLLQWKLPDGGLYFWCRLAPRLSASRVLARAMGISLTFVPGHAFYVDNAGDRELRLCFSALPPASADDAARRLMRAVALVQAESNGETNGTAAVAVSV